MNDVFDAEKCVKQIKNSVNLSKKILPFETGYVVYLDNENNCKLGEPITDFKTNEVTIDYAKNKKERVIGTIHTHAFFDTFFSDNDIITSARMKDKLSIIITPINIYWYNMDDLTEKDIKKLDDIIQRKDKIDYYNKWKSIINFSKEEIIETKKDKKKIGVEIKELRNKIKEITHKI